MLYYLFMGFFMKRKVGVMYRFVFIKKKFLIFMLLNIQIRKWEFLRFVVFFKSGKLKLNI